jgi:hypothetical protein
LLRAPPAPSRLASRCSLPLASARVRERRGRCAARQRSGLGRSGRVRYVCLSHRLIYRAWPGGRSLFWPAGALPPPLEVTADAPLGWPPGFAVVQLLPAPPQTCSSSFSLSSLMASSFPLRNAANSALRPMTSQRASVGPKAARVYSPLG